MECKNCAIAIVFSALAMLPVSGLAYETPTHEMMSEAALKNSTLFAADGVLKELGIVVPNKIEDFEEEEGGPPVEGNQRFHDFFLKKNDENQRNVIGHIRLGSAYEDHENTFWVCSHFFDPLNKQPLRPILCPSWYNFRSPNWALSGIDKDGNLIANRSDALMRDGNQRFLLALTSEDKTTREEYFGSLFRNIGQAIHHIQDMAQPQHVRDDPHLPIVVEASFYEKYSNCKYRVDEPTKEPSWFVKAASYIALGGCNKDKPPPEVLPDYPEISLNQFNHSEKFWINYGKGMAEFTNANFVSQDTNFRITSGAFSTHVYTYSEYSLPDPDNGGNGADITPSRIEAPIPKGLGSAPGQDLRGEIWFFGTTVTDKYTDSEAPNPRTSSRSIFASDLEGLAFNSLGLANPALVGRIPMFSLNRFTFDAAHEHLLPRAAAYSTGLIDYFFRGRMEIIKVVYLGGSEITVTVKNVTADKNPDNAAYMFSRGNFRLYYDDVDDNRTQLAPDDWDDEVLLTGPEVFDNEGELTMTFDLASNGVPIDIDFKKPFTLVFEGKIGHRRMAWSGWELGIAATTFYAEPLLSFDISRSDGSAPVPNVIDIYASYDLGLNWETVSEAGISITINDSSLDPLGFNRLAINAVTYIGNRELLIFPDYLDYFDGTSFVTRILIDSFRAGGYGAEDVAAGIGLDWSTALSGAGNNFSDWMAVLHSLSATGSTSLAALRISKPPFTDPPPRVRTYELMSVPDWSMNTNWVMSGNPDAGGLPELDWLGDDNFVMAVQIEASETGNPDARELESALRITNDGGLSYAELARIAVCEADDDTCVQHIVPMDEGRLFGWIEQHASDYPGNTTLYTSPDGGASWEVLGVTPGTAECNPGPLRYTEIDAVIYLGSSRPEVGVVNDVLFIETTCKEIIEDGGFYSGLNIISTNVFASNDSARNWTEVSKPPKMNGRIIYAGDNGVVPGIFE